MIANFIPECVLKYRVVELITMPSLKRFAVQALSQGEWYRASERLDKEAAIRLCDELNENGSEFKVIHPTP